MNPELAKIAFDLLASQSDEDQLSTGEYLRAVLTVNQTEIP